MATLQQDQVIIFILQLHAYVLKKNIENKVIDSEYKLYFFELRFSYIHGNKVCMLKLYFPYWIKIWTMGISYT